MERSSANYDYLFDGVKDGEPLLHLRWLWDGPKFTLDLVVCIQRIMTRGHSKSTISRRIFWQLFNKCHFVKTRPKDRSEKPSPKICARSSLNHFEDIIRKPSWFKNSKILSTALKFQSCGKGDQPTTGIQDCNPTYPVKFCLSAYGRIYHVFQNSIMKQLSTVVSCKKH